MSLTLRGLLGIFSASGITASVLTVFRSNIAGGGIHQFNANVNFDDVLELYIFDRKLRCLFWEALERVEIHIRTQWVYELTTLTQDPFAHLNSNNFSSRKKHLEDLDKLRNEINRSKEEVFVKHFSENYEEETPPLWACVHLMTLGELIHWVQNTHASDVKNRMARSFGFAKYYPFGSFAVALTELRNVCAPLESLLYEVTKVGEETNSTRLRRISAH